MADKVINIKGLNKYYKTGNEKLHVLKNIDLSVYEGEFTAILGPSGSGKTTLMNVIGCMDNFDSGEYYLDGLPIHSTKEKKLTGIRNKKIGFIFQDYHLIPTYTVIQNVIMPLLMRGYSEKKAEKETEPLIQALGLSERTDHKPNELSGGQSQRTAIARALSGNPSIILADEPTGALDRKTGREVLEIFKKINSTGNTIIMITHDLGVADEAGRIVNIVDGELSESA